MEPHPIPQNVTSFQFKLVGDMTLKQFAYLATGSSIAYLLFVFLAPRYPFFAWPLILISALLGVAFAFLPIGSRSLDHWVKAFFRAVYSPTKRVWRKNNKVYQKEPLFGSRFVMYLTGFPPQTTTAALKTPLLQSSAPAQLPTQEQLQKTVDLAKQAQTLQVRIIQTERTLNQIRSEAQKPQPLPANYHEQVKKILSDLNILVAQASQIRSQLETVTEPEQTAPAVKPLVLPKVIKIQQVKPKTVNVALTTLPNVLNGIIKDVSGNLLEGVICVIYDKEGLPVRALKTNKLGQFSGSTPLPNGTYTLELEKETYQFDVLQIELLGEVLPPLLIMAKTAAQT